MTYAVVNICHRMATYDLCSSRYLSSNGNIVIVVLGDLDLHFQDKTFFCYAFADGRMDGRKDRKDGWTDGQTNGRTDILSCTRAHACTDTQTRRHVDKSTIAKDDNATRCTAHKTGVRNGI